MKHVADTTRPVAGDLLEGLSRLEARSRSEQLAATLERRISERGMRAGDRVGTLDEIRDEVGFARSTVSEAVRLLRERGVLEIRPGRGGGLFVAEPSPVIAMRRTLLTAAQGSSELVREAIELRDALEELIALDASRFCTAADEARLRERLATMEAEIDDVGRFMSANWDLHREVASICSNSMAAAVYTSTLGYLSETTPSQAMDPSAALAYRRDRYEAHAGLVDAIVGGEPVAIRAAVERHGHRA